MRINDQDALRYYWQELHYLREAGRGFARRYPKIAGRLELEPGGCADPHVERLLESFAFLTARIQKGLDEDFPEIASELMQILYPHLTCPVPAMAIARFDVDSERGKLTSGYLVPAHTPVFAPGTGGNICRFRTGHKLELWPIEVLGCELVLPEQFPFLDRDSRVVQVLRIRLEAPAVPFHALELKTLRFFLHADPLVAATLYQVVMSEVLRVVLLGEGEAPIELPKEGAIRPVGFAEEDEVLPYPAHAQPAYRLLQEYFAFPQKFHFFDLHGFERARAGRRLDVLLLLDRTPKGPLRLDSDAFLLGCTPIVNLFRRTSEPIRWDQRRLEYLLEPDSRRRRNTEIHSILKVSSAAHPDEPARVYHPFYSYSHSMLEQEHKTFWHARRIPSTQADGIGSELYLSFLDLDQKSSQPADEILYAHTLCTNRDLAEELPAGALLQTDVGLPAQRIVCLQRPTRQGHPPGNGQNLWKLVSHLSLNYLSGEAEGNDARALRELLRLYDFTGSQGVEQQAAGLRKIATRPVLARLGAEAWRGFAQGREIRIVLDESAYTADKSAFLFASVLEQFFGLYAATNSFSQLVLESETREGVWHKWPPRAGRKIVG